MLFPLLVVWFNPATDPQAPLEIGSKPTRVYGYPSGFL